MPTFRSNTTAPVRYTSRAPAKLILSGEHAVVHGHPALAVAVNMDLSVELQPNATDHIEVAFPDFFDPCTCRLDQLDTLKRRLDERHKEFLHGTRAIENLLDGPADICFYACALHRAIYPDTLTRGIYLRYHADFPLGGGMGGSAALIAATLSGLAQATGTTLSRSEWYERTCHIERLVHGRPSGIDPYVVVYGGGVRFQAGQPTACIIALPALDWVYTGTPEAHTGECVAVVAKRFPAEHTIWTEFANITCELETALGEGDPRRITKAIQKNHRLLVELGVVPPRVQDFVKEIESQGGAAKICGAGSIRGPCGGALWVWQDPDLETRCEAYNYPHRTLRIQAPASA